MEKNRSIFSMGRIILLVLIVLAMPMLPLFISRRWDWWEAWFYAIASIAGFIASRALAARRHADLLQERARMLNQADAKAWDKLLAPLVGFGGGLIPLTVGVDALFGHSAAFSLPVKIIAISLILAGYGLANYALIENRFFSGMVRIQTDRGHTVISSGPYAWIRHPGYAGGMLTFLAAPFLLDSAWALLPAGLLCAALIARTRLEDQTLQAELPGYTGYAQRVRYRLLPGIW